MKYKYVTLLVMMLMLVGCASTQTKWVDPTARQVPDPHYVLQAIGEPLTATFYYTAVTKVRDVDGTSVGRFVYLSMSKYHNIDASKYQNLALIIEMNNPTRLRYELYEQTKVEIGDMRNEVQMGGVVNASTLEYRQFVYSLPIGESVRGVEHSVDIFIEGQKTMQIGSFRYNLIH